MTKQRLSITQISVVCRKPENYLTYAQNFRSFSPKEFFLWYSKKNFIKVLFWNKKQKAFLRLFEYSKEETDFYHIA